MCAPSFLAVTSTPSIAPSCAEETVPEIAAPVWACAVATWNKAAAATADKSVEIVLPDIDPSLAGGAKSVKQIQPSTIHKGLRRGKARRSAEGGNSTCRSPH